MNVLHVREAAREGNRGWKKKLNQRLDQECRLMCLKQNTNVAQCVSEMEQQIARDRARDRPRRMSEVTLEIGA